MGEGEDDLGGPLQSADSDQAARSDHERFWYSAAASDFIPPLT